MGFPTLLLTICDAHCNQMIPCVSQIRPLSCQESFTCFPTCLKSKVLSWPLRLDSSSFYSSHTGLLVVLQKTLNMPSEFLLWELCTCCSLHLRSSSTLSLYWCSSFWSQLKYHPNSLPSLLLSSWNSIPVISPPLSPFHFPSDTYIFLPLFRMSPQ